MPIKRDSNDNYPIAGYRIFSDKHITDQPKDVRDKIALMCDEEKAADGYKEEILKYVAPVNQLEVTLKLESFMDAWSEYTLLNTELNYMKYSNDDILRLQAEHLDSLKG